MLAASVFIGLLLLIVVPAPRFDKPTSTVVLSADGRLLGARIAGDGQWRFPQTDSLPANYEIALLTFEDNYFYRHPGINPVSAGRALFQNLKQRRIVSGGSTITMQLARLSRNNPPRTIGGKLLEMGMALKLELLKSKKEILRLYASNAPFGGNVVGIDAASWRYFKRPAHQLSWAEVATLAVLPNAPSLLYPGKNSEALRQKRDRLLHRLLQKKLIDSLSYSAALAEPVPDSPKTLPDLAYHLIEEAGQQHRGKKVSTSIDFDLQQKANSIVMRNAARLQSGGINNMAAIIAEVNTGNVVCYLGNTPGLDKQHQGYVNIVNAPRSTGSILKPFLYAAMLQYGEILPDALIRDVPVNFSGYSPSNFDYSYSGAVRASEALSKSLNVPAVEMLHQFGEARFLNVLHNLGFSTFDQAAEHYGLSLILGGGEASLFELAGAYASMARSLNHYTKSETYPGSDIHPLVLFPEATKPRENTALSELKAASVYFTFDALQRVNRPDERSGWWNFSSSNRIAWKTGTSFGFRDAWAVAITPRYVVAVWAGNANGEGKPGLTGSRAAAPVLFDLLDLLPKSGWFAQPFADMTVLETCRESGYTASALCPHRVSRDVPVSGLRTKACPYHQIVHLSADRQWQVNSSCYPVSQMHHDSVMVLPPSMEWYYRQIHPNYYTLPPVKPGCISDRKIAFIELISPRNLKKLYVPNEMNGEKGRIVFEAAHRNRNSRLFWHVDGTFIGETDQFHQMALAPGPGTHTLTIIDGLGNTLVNDFTIFSDKQ